ncbi:Zinc-finger homeodomain protein 9 [Hibiscus syriacus]|uniref:Zinc-finger homeodomain protein 9 n=1 Tax=Hibiscus syriacus TaxID=106335 RepID=A0A6A2XS69_HIBSY|nr:zinc-finger homeodomain protein 9-like [Hibiscus syriacus]KAE8678452.1 Zinc-finger homeodomain protein 9 [Hibiscus syriacus]
MDIALASNTPKSPEAEPEPEPVSETPTRIQPGKPLSFTNGVLKRHKPQQQAPPIVIAYKECLKNHAATLGGHALDGCGEFMPSPTATPTDPTSLKCAACGCHRNFHRREPDDPPPTTVTATIEYQPHHRHHPPPPLASQPNRSPNSASPPPISSSYYPSSPHMLLALSGGLTNSHLPAGGLAPNTANLGSNSKKRFRTKFSQYQKDKMLEFAEKIGWKIQKRYEQDIQKFCHEVVVDREVLKVWMHNNKNTFGKKDQANGGSRDGIQVVELNHEEQHKNNNNNSSGDHHRNGQNLNHHFEADGVAHLGTNGCSSSSS